MHKGNGQIDDNLAIAILRKLHSIETRIDSIDFEISLINNRLTAIELEIRNANQKS